VPRTRVSLPFGFAIETDYPRKVDIALMTRPLKRIDKYLFVDDQNRFYFCVTDFFHHNPKIRDTPESRALVAQRFKELFPGSLIFEEYNQSTATEGQRLAEPISTSEPGSIEISERKTPVAVRAGQTVKAFALIEADYIQAHQTVTCPLCPVRYLLFVHYKDRKEGQNQREVRPEIAKLFFELIAKDHATGHLQDQFIVPPFSDDEGL
jgi:hypothetical protein